VALASPGRLSGTGVMSVAVLTVDSVGVESSGGGHPLSDVSLAPGADQAVA
jgi:hypothetical protein